jgi:hypothetical protein
MICAVNQIYYGCEIMEDGYVELMKGHENAKKTLLEILTERESSTRA